MAHYHCMSNKQKKPQIYSLLTRNAKHWKKWNFIHFFLKYLTKIFFRKLKLPSPHNFVCIWHELTP